jgi:hypothetical protein
MLTFDLFFFHQFGSYYFTMGPVHVMLLVCIPALQAASIQRVNVRDITQISTDVQKGGQFQPNIRLISGSLDKEVSFQNVIKPAAGISTQEVDPLVEDLAQMKPVEKSGVHPLVSMAARPLSEPVQDEMDIMLLYGLIRAVEYEANIKLFDKVLQDLEQSAASPVVDVNNDVQRPYAVGQQPMTSAGNAPVAAGSIVSGSPAAIKTPVDTQDTQKVSVREGKVGRTAVKAIPAPPALQQQQFHNMLSQRSVPIIRMMAAPVPMTKRTQKVPARQ